jgi:hypothetical protein
MNRVVCPPSLADASFSATSACTHYPVFKEPTSTRARGRHCLRVSDLRRSHRSSRRSSSEPLERPHRVSAAVRLGEPFKVTSDDRACQASPETKRRGVAAELEKHLDTKAIPSLRGQALHLAALHASRAKKIASQKKIAENTQHLPLTCSGVSAPQGNTKYHRAATPGQVSRSRTFCFCPFRITSKRPSIACVRVTRPYGSDIRRLLTYTPPDCTSRRASLRDAASPA